VLLITLGVILGLLGIAAAAKKRQRYRIPAPTNTVAMVGELGSWGVGELSSRGASELSR